MNPAQPEGPSPVTQPAAESAAPAVNGRLSGVKKAVGGFFSGGTPSPEATVQTQPNTTPAWLSGGRTEPAPGVQPAGNHDFDTKPATSAVPSLASVPEPTFSSAALTPTPTTEPSPVVPSSLPEDPFAPKPPTQEPSILTPEPSPTPEAAASSVWTPDPIAEKPVSNGVTLADYAAAGEEAFKNIAATPSVDASQEKNPADQTEAGQLSPVEVISEIHKLLGRLDSTALEPNVANTIQTSTPTIPDLPNTPAMTAPVISSPSIPTQIQ